MKESDVGKVVIDYLKDLRRKVYCEVAAAGGRIDIVALDEKNRITSVELKTRLSFDLLTQSIDRSAYSHWSIAACPKPKNMRAAHIAVRTICETYGIGLWFVRGKSVEVHCVPRLNRNALSKYILNELHDGQMNQDAGVNQGHRSPFRQTVSGLTRYVANHQGCSLKDAIESIDHHYSTRTSARSSIASWIRSGVIDGVEMRDGRMFLSGEADK